MTYEVYRGGATLDTVFDQDHEIIDISGQFGTQAADVASRVPGIAGPDDDDGGPLAEMIRRGCYLALDPDSGVPSVELREGEDSTAWYGAGGSAANPTKYQRRRIITPAGSGGIVQMRKPLLLPPMARYLSGLATTEAKYPIGGWITDDDSDYFQWPVILHASPAPISFPEGGRYSCTYSKELNKGAGVADYYCYAPLMRARLRPRGNGTATITPAILVFYGTASALNGVCYVKNFNRAGVELTGPSNGTTNNDSHTYSVAIGLQGRYLQLKGGGIAGAGEGCTTAAGSIMAIEGIA